MQKKHLMILMVLGAILLFFSNGSLLVTDSVESNYALTAKEMVLSGDWVSPQIYGHYWYDKPVFFYWLTALAFKIFGFTEFAARLFPALFGLGGLVLTYWGGTKLYNEKSGFYGSMMLLSCVEFFLISKSIITDAVLFVFFNATLLFFYLGYRDNKSQYWYAMYASSALAVLTKGPIGMLLPGLIMVLFLLWQRDWRVIKRVRLFSGLALFAALCLPWYIVMWQLHGDAFLGTFLGTHNFLRATVSEHPRDNVIYYYLLVNTLALFPWTAVLPYALRREWQERKLNGSVPVREGFLLIWAATIFVFFQCMATKYITYTYPMLMPAFIYLGAYVAEHEDVLYKKPVMFFNGFIFALLLVAGWYVDYSDIVEVQALFLLPISLLLGLFICLYMRNQDISGIYQQSTINLVFYLALIVAIAVPMSDIRSAKNMSHLLASSNQKQVAIFGGYPTSLVFYSGKKVVQLVPEEKMEDFAPKSFSWNSKNVMPYECLEEEKNAIVIVKEQAMEDFAELDNGPERRIVAQMGKWNVLADRSATFQVIDGFKVSSK